MAKLFGTDGVRGVANGDLTPELVYRLGRAAGIILKPEEKRAVMVVGRDTRLSGPMLEGALVAGICSAGIDVYTAGVIPTPGVAYLSKVMDACAGAVISASHNPAPDNGIKFFNHLGFKLDDELEEKIEAIINLEEDIFTRPTGKDLGRVIPFPGAVDRYGHFLKSVVNTDLSGLKIIVDCANGAACQVAPKVLRDLGAQVISLNDMPDGLNINAGCGSTYPEFLQKSVHQYGADLGLAFDGDSDRVIAVDEEGNVVNGDNILVICGLDLSSREELAENKLVVTVMSNMGLKLACERAGISVLETGVGDRYVLEKMLKSGAILGGEQSGHIIFLRHNTTGDGVLTGLKLVEVIKKSGKSLSELAKLMETLPQILINVQVKNKEGWESNGKIMNAVLEGEKVLTGRGRILVRASGTEPLIRIMAEGPDKEELDRIVQRIAGVVTTELGS